MRFIIFMLVFFSLYGGMHCYAFLKVKRALIFGSGATALLVIFMGCMIFSPVIIRLAERHGFDHLARLLAYVGYTWMGLLFLFISVAFALDIYRLLIHVAGWIPGADLSDLSLSPRHSFFICLILAIVLTIYGAFEAFAIRTEHVIIRSHKIPKTIGRLKIVQISDVHLGLIVREKRLEKILQKVNAANPDILISTGDLVDGQIDKLSGIAHMLRQVSAPYGKFAITGNHEFYAGLARSLDFIEKAGFTILRGDGFNVSNILNIAGVDDETGKRYGLASDNSERKILSKFPPEQFTLLLKHRPVVDDGSLGLFDLQLSGHTHKGQIFPFNLVTKLYYPNHAGLLELEKNSRLYVSRGTGTWGPPVRFLSAPEVTLIELVHEAPK